MLQRICYSVNSSGVWQSDNGPIPGIKLVDFVRKATILEDDRAVAVPPQMPPGKAQFEVGLYRYHSAKPLDALDRVDLVDGKGNRAGDRVDLGAVMVGAPPPQADLSGLTSLGATFDDRIELVGWQARIDPEDDSQLLVDLGWRVADRSVTDYTVFVHLLGNDDQVLTQHDEPLGGSQNSTSRWVPGETVRTIFALQVAPGSSARDHRLRVGLYEPVSGRQLPLTRSTANGTVAHGETYLILAPAK
jgi:hypothetical protein